ncbi:MAG: glycosyltransferase family 4 protein [Myxococcales bacterium]
MKILQLTRDYPPAIKGGISTAVEAMVRGLHRQGARCAVVSFDGYRPRGGGAAPAPALERRDVAPVLRVSSPAHLDAARALARELRPDVIHVHHGMLWELAAELRDAQGCAAVKSVHVLQREQNRLRAVQQPTASQRGQQRALREADRVLVPTRAAAQALLADDAALAPRLHVVPPAVTVSLPRPRPRASDGPPRLLWVGRFAELKGAAELCEILPAVAERSAAARFEVVGGVPDNRKAERRWRARLQQAMEAHPGRMTLHGWLPPSQVRAELARARLLLSTSWTETFGLSVAEAMACGTAVVATQVGGVAELLEQGACGELRPRGDCAGLTRASVQLLEDPERAFRLGAAGQARIAARHDPERCARALISALDCRPAA